MSRYYSFNDYMNDVLMEADKRCQQLKSCRLYEFVDVSARTFEGATKIIRRNWNNYHALTEFLASNADMISIADIIASFLRTLVGVAIAAVLGISAVKTIKEMSADKILTPAVRDTGEKYRSKWEELEGEQDAIDALVEAAAGFLLWRVGVTEER